MTQDTIPTRDEAIQMAREAGGHELMRIDGAQDSVVALTGNAAIERFFQAAYAMGAAAESKRADALAATIAALCAMVTTNTETKAEFIDRVRAVLGEDPDARVVRAVAAEREARQTAQTQIAELQERLNRADAEKCAAVLAEREACAKVCDERGMKFWTESPFAAECHGLAESIRARSQA